MSPSINPVRQQLLDLLPPPASPMETDGNLPDVLNRLHLRLPPDFVEICRLYGSGRFPGLSGLMLGNPLSPRFKPWFTRKRDHLKQERKNAVHLELEPHFPFAVFPALPGVVPFAASTNGVVVCWWASQHDPAAWPILVFAGEIRRKGMLPRAWARYDMSASAFLLKGLTGGLYPLFAATDIPTVIEPRFVPEPLW